uniref:Histone deacetylase domain-containing protein n=1 Tax=Chlamydomonas euryale TaxID=1486919 RepID=A0A7R9V615_9CHLO|mmetsp:Transcript_21208/g.63532  ORF Transcript_21208/g.63532 Transcript_21208/m.63532 type:complete len:360 (+) Transcript_21208:289-1368(+)
MAALPSAPASLSFAGLRRPAVAGRCLERYRDVLKAWPTPKQLPIVYSPRYNITFLGLEKLHPFDSAKYEKIVKTLQKRGLFAKQQLVEPLEAPLEVLRDVHTDQYVANIHNSSLTVAQVTELAPLAVLPVWLLRQRVVSPMRYHVSGTMAAAALAMQYGWAINLGGGMHHAFSATGSGWCPFDDIYLAIRRLRDSSQGEIQKVLYIDLDAHQGNGVERDKLLHQDENLFIIDVYNASVFPKDTEAKAGIDISVELRSGVDTATYMQRLQQALRDSLDRFKPHVIFYNAGTDVLVDDPLGLMMVDEAGVIARDQAVWSFALNDAQAPIVMTLSGGYAKRSAAVVADSVTALLKKYHLTDL